MSDAARELQVVTSDTNAALFDTSTPDLVIEKAQGIAKKLTGIIEQAKLFSNISNRRYVKCEGWTTMLAMLGVFPHVEYCRKIDGDVIAYEARVVLKTIEGKAVGSGEALCTSLERNWSGRDEFAIKSMAQTRATGKAARNAFSWIMALAGYEATPAEEMVGDEHFPRQEAAPAKAKPAKAPPPVNLETSNRVTSTFDLSNPLTSKSGNTYWRAIDEKGSLYLIWDEWVYNELKSSGKAKRTVEVKREGKFTSIDDVMHVNKTES